MAEVVLLSRKHGKREGPDRSDRLAPPPPLSGAMSVVVHCRCNRGHLFLRRSETVQTLPAATAGCWRWICISWGWLRCSLTNLSVTVQPILCLVLKVSDSNLLSLFEVKHRITFLWILKVLKWKKKKKWKAGILTGNERHRFRVFCF